jgi:hypothetical protein
MKKFIFQIIVFPLLFIAIIIGSIYLTSYIVKLRKFKINESDSNTMTMGKNNHYDFVLSGASHARNLSRHGNHYRVEKILNKHFSNIAQGENSCGVEEQYFYLKYFYELGNTTNEVVYFLSPPLLYSKTLPIASNTFNSECFSIKFLKSYINYDLTENKRQRIFEYIKSKLTWQWINLHAKDDSSMDGQLDRVDSAVVASGIAEYYNINESQERFKKATMVVEEEIKYVLAHHSKFIIVFPPASFGRWPGNDQVIGFAKEMQKKYGIEYYDFFESVMTPKYYYDHHHLNSAGVVYFTENFLKPIL